MSEFKTPPIAARLRASVLQQAIQGRLVPQDPADEPASALLERIRKYRAELVKQKKAKVPKGGESRIFQGADGSWYEQRGKSAPVCIDEEIPFDIPESWGWVRFTQVVPVLYGFAFKSELFSSAAQIGLIRIRDVNSGDLCHTETGYIGDFDSRYVIHSGDALIGMDGDFRCRPWGGPDALLNQRVCKLEPYDGIELAFLLCIMDWYLQEINKRTGGTTVKHLSAKALDSLLFAVPPTREQRRIAFRFVEVMPLIDQLEIKERESDSVDSAFWRMLPQSILQQAVEGKLVPQDADDEPACVLLERIRKERAELVKQKKAKATKGGESRIYQGADGSWYEQRGNAAPVCIDEEIPFDIPESWEWARLNDYAEAVVDCPHSTPKYLPSNVDTGFYAIDTNCMDDYWNQTGSRNVSETDYLSRTQTFRPCVGDVVLSREASIGRVVILKGNNHCLGQRVMLIRCGTFMIPAFLRIVLSSPYCWAKYRKMNQGTGVKHINVSAIRSLLIMVPPLAEQRRIARKVYETVTLTNDFAVAD